MAISDSWATGSWPAPPTPQPAYAGYAPTAPSTPAAPAYRPDTYAATATGPRIQANGGGWLGWLGGAAVAGLVALPKLARFGPIGLFTSVIVILAGGFYGNAAVGAGQELLNGQPRGAVTVAAWIAGGTMVAKAIASWRSPGALLAAFVIWLGSWGAGKVVDMIWPSR